MVWFYRWTLHDVLQGLTPGQFWSAIDFMAQYNHDQREAMKADPMGGSLRQMQQQMANN